MDPINRDPGKRPIREVPRGNVRSQITGRVLEEKGFDPGASSQFNTDTRLGNASIAKDRVKDTVVVSRFDSSTTVKIKTLPDGTGAVLTVNVYGEEKRAELSSPDAVEFVPKERLERELREIRNKTRDFLVSTAVGLAMLVGAGILILMLKHNNNVRELNEQMALQESRIEKVAKSNRNEVREEKGQKSKQERYEEAMTDDNEDTIRNTADWILNQHDEWILNSPISIGQIFAIYEWVRDNFAYASSEQGTTPDPVARRLKEKLDPDGIRTADCKNMTATLVALAKIKGARMAAVTTECETQPGGECVGHVFAAVRVYKIGEFENNENKLRAYEIAKQTIKDKILIRYPELSLVIEEKGIMYIEREDGLWLVLDPTINRNGYPGRGGTDMIIKEFMVFGERDGSLSLE